MKKCIYRIFVIIIAIIILMGNSHVYGKVCQGEKVKKIVIHESGYSLDALGKSTSNFSKSTILQELKKDYNYDGKLLKKGISIKTTISITDVINPKKILGVNVGSTKYKIKIGNKKFSKEYTKNELKNVFGLTEEPKKDTKWEAVIKCDVPSHEKEIPDGTDGTSGHNYIYQITAKEITTGKDMPTNIDNTTGDEVNLGALEQESGEGGLAAAFDFVGNMLKNPIGTIITIALDVIRAIFGDAPQIIANLVQNISANSEFFLTYDKDTLINEGSNGAHNKYTNVKEEVETEDDVKNWQKYISITDGGYDGNSEIPVIPVDMYNMAMGKVDFLDVNFLVIGNNHSANSLWVKFRNIIAVFIHVVMYLAAGILLMALIWHGIVIAKGSFDDPRRRASHKEGLQRFVTSLGMLIGTILIMALFINLNEIIFDSIEVQDTDELPIRVSVQEANYSFSTNFTGYLRYRAGIEDVDLWLSKAGYTLLYIFVVWFNFIAVIFMILRMFAMSILAIAGFCIAACYALNKQGILPFSYMQWLKLYAILALVQFLFAIGSLAIFACIG